MEVINLLSDNTFHSFIIFVIDDVFVGVYFFLLAKQLNLC